MNRNKDGRLSAAVPVDEQNRAGDGKHASPSSSQRPSVKESVSETRNAAALKKKAIANVHREKERRSKLARRLVLFICAFCIFCLGFFLRGFEPFMNRIDPTLVSSNASTQATSTTPTVYNSVSARVAEVEKILNTSSIESYDTDTVSDAVLESFATSSDDAYLRYFDDERYALYVKEASSNAYEGVGVLFAEFEGNCYAADVFSGSVAEFAGVQQGDVVVAVNGDSSQKWTPTEVINAINKNSGSEIVITWRRSTTLDGQGDTTFSTTLRCQEYHQANVEASLESNNIGLISIKQISQNSATLVDRAVQALVDQGAKSFVLDLRDCPGGYLTQAVNIASLFVKSGTLVQIETKEGVTNKTASGQVITSLPVVVVVNGSTAGTAEVLACALRDNDVAQIVGASTLGKGTVQVVQKLSFGGAIRYTAARYLSPSGHQIDGKGVSPDTTVSDSSDQLSVAMRLASSLASTR